VECHHKDLLVDYHHKASNHVDFLGLECHRACQCRHRFYLVREILKEYHNRDYLIRECLLQQFQVKEYLLLSKVLECHMDILRRD
jgi:hypothetical protein